MQNKASIIKTNNVSKIYTLGKEKIYALSEVNVDIVQGDFLAIVGKSGSGKSTLMHILSLLDTPTLGEVFLNGEDVSNLSERQLSKIRNREIGFVFQSFNLLPRATSVENVTLPLQYSNIPRNEWREKAVKALELVGLENRLSNKSNELSGGQRQRVAIARALVTNPSIIFADEPTGNLDTKTSNEIEKLFTRLNEQGITIVMVTHDEDLAKISKRKIVLGDGKIINGG